MTINQRIAEIINKLFRNNKRAFSAAIGVNPSVIENIVGKRRSSPSFDITNKIISSIENINIEWLMTGKGEMLKINDVNNMTDSFVSDKIVSQNELSRIFSMLIFDNYKSNHDTKIKFDSFERLSKQFEATVSLCKNIQNTLETEITLSMYHLMLNNIKEGIDGIIPDELMVIIDKYDKLYSDFLDESGAMLKLIELTRKHQDTMIRIMKEIHEKMKTMKG